MKYAIIIPDGAADFPIAEFGGKTPFEAARKPATDRLSLHGRLGTVATTPPKGFTCGSDVCIMNLMGYDPALYHRGRAPLEAASMGIPLTPTDWVFRVNLITVLDGKFQDHSAGHISDAEARKLLADLAPHLDIPGMTIFPGVSYRNIMVDRSNGDASGRCPPGGRDWTELQTTPPHDVPGEPMEKYLPVGSPYAETLREMIRISAEVFDAHEINQTRKDLGELPATHVWPWGQGRKPAVPSFQSRFGVKGAMITAVDLAAGVASLIGWDRLQVPGQTSYHDTDYIAAGQHAIRAFDQYDLVCVHIEAPDEAGHASDPKTKVASIEAMDQHIVAPIHAHLERRGEPYRILYLPDHFTLVSNRKHDPTPVPFAVCGHKFHTVVPRTYGETNASQADLHIKFGHELMEFFLKSGLN